MLLCVGCSKPEKPGGETPASTPTPAPARGVPVENGWSDHRQVSQRLGGKFKTSI